MAEGVIPTWQVLACVQCAGTTFLQLVRLKAKPGGGTTIEGAGVICQQCQAPADVGQMQFHAYRQQRLDELRALEAEMAASPPAAPSVTPPGAV
jgi:hypothetical protein